VLGSRPRSRSATCGRAARGPCGPAAGPSVMAALRTWSSACSAGPGRSTSPRRYAARPATHTDPWPPRNQIRMKPTSRQNDGALGQRHRKRLLLRPEQPFPPQYLPLGIARWPILRLAWRPVGQERLDATLRAGCDWQLPELLMGGRRHGRPPPDLVTCRTAHGADLANTVPTSPNRWSASERARTPDRAGGTILSHRANRIGTGLTGCIAT
jgi:hypothetical protein